MKTTRAYIAARYAGGVGNYDHPIQQIARRSGTRLQLGFSTEATELIPATDGFLLAPSREGLHVLARKRRARLRAFALHPEPSPFLASPGKDARQAAASG